MNITTLITSIQKLSKDHNKRIFTLRELAILSNESNASVGMALLRAKRRGIVDRIKNIWINMMNKPTLEEIALETKSPSYISFESALYRHGILSQSPRGLLTLATLTRPEKISTPLGDIQYIRLSPKLFFGFDAQKLATAEKAFLDLIYIRTRRGTPELSETFHFDLLNKRKVSSFAKKFPKYVMKAVSETICKAGENRL